MKAKVFSSQDAAVEWAESIRGYDVHKIYIASTVWFVATPMAATLKQIQELFGHPIVSSETIYTGRPASQPAGPREA